MISALIRGLRQRQLVILTCWLATGAAHAEGLVKDTGLKHTTPPVLAGAGVHRTIATSKESQDRSDHVERHVSVDTRDAPTPGGPSHLPGATADAVTERQPGQAAGTAQSRKKLFVSASIL